ncbi:MAG: hypothetical protein IPK72_16170 [Candidatus Eisenbacteria bacterium]|nr:hypothetical protein [Candidatus Eisenbacteria bacterium]
MKSRALAETQRAEIAHPVILVRVNRLFREGMTEHELYEVTRGVWKLGPRREKAGYALAVFRRVVRGVYAIHSWHPAGTVPYETRQGREVRQPGRWEFVGGEAPPRVQAAYLGRSVEVYLPRGSRNPVIYVGC